MPGRERISYETQYNAPVSILDDPLFCHVYVASNGLWIGGNSEHMKERTTRTARYPACFSPSRRKCSAGARVAKSISTEFTSASETVSIVISILNVNNDWNRGEERGKRKKREVSEAWRITRTFSP
jgi:hypothetical protein